MPDRGEVAVNCLLTYFAEMYKWEDETDRLLSSPEVRAMDYESRIKEKKIRRALLEDIFHKYCEVGKDAKRLQGGGLSYGTPRAYDPPHESIISVEEKKNGIIIVVTSRTDNPVDTHFKYELIEVDSQFLIKDNKKMMSAVFQRWSSHML